MKIKSLQLKNFKRFTDLTLQDIPDKAKLVLLIGGNGSGKSSVFDAFERIATEVKQKGIAQFNLNKEYYSKYASVDYSILIKTVDNKILRNNAMINELPQAKAFYGRTSFRQIPRLRRTGLGNNFNIELDSDRPLTYIDRDERFENDLEHIFGKLLREYFVSKNSSEIYEKVIDPINEAFTRIFGENQNTFLKLENIIPPLEGKVAEITFNKGNSFFQYNQLSAGEKEIFNILINFVARKEYYTDSIFFFDEIDLHLNTKLQYTFLKEIIENWIPDNCQFWTASHSLGFIEYAKDYENGCIIDLDDLDFDRVEVLFPKPKESFEIFEIAVSKAFIDKAVQGRKIIFSENTDTSFYNDLNIDNTFFFVAIDKNDVFHKAKNLRQFGLIDRDYLSDEEISEIKKTYNNLFVLPYYSFENLIYHPDNLHEYYNSISKPFDKENYLQQIAKAKNDERDYLAAGIIQARSGYPFFKENENVKSLKEFRDNYKAIIELLRSDDFEQFYKVFPAKDYGKDISDRKNASQNDLAKTNWFKKQIEETIK
jgi:hypothetical protein